MRDVRDIGEAVAIVREIALSGRMPLFHGTPKDFDRIEVSEERSRGFANSVLGVHVTSDPFLAFEYVGKGSEAGGILILSVTPGRFGLLDGRDVYINIDAAGLEEIKGMARFPIIGVMADDLGDDLNGAGFVFSLDDVEVVARIPAAMARDHLHGAGKLEEDPALMVASCEIGCWRGAETEAIDTYDMTDRYRLDEPGW